MSSAGGVAAGRASVRRSGASCAGSGAAAETGGADAVAGALGASSAASPPSDADFTSRSTMRPPGPVPWTLRRSMPRSVASLRASGDASTLPVGVAGAGAAARGAGAGRRAGAETAAFKAAAAGAGAAAGLATGAALGASALAAGLLPPAVRALASWTSAAMSSPALPMMAMGVPTGIEAPSATRRLSSTPSSKASKSMVALSVSTSANTSPGETLSPSFFRHFRSTPIFIVSDSCGISRIVAMCALRFLLYRVWDLFEVEQLLHGRDGSRDIGHALHLEVVVVRHGHVGACEPLDGGVELVEATPAHAIRDLGAHAVERPPFLDDEAAARLLDGLDDELLVERADRARVDDLDLDALGGELLGRAQRDLHHLRPADDG